MKELFDTVSIRCSKITTILYSTSFSLGILGLHKRIRNPIYAVYGFVRFADEIVDSFHDYNKHDLLNRFERETYAAIEEKISLNPILNSFQHTVHQFDIDGNLIDAFFNSMRMDLDEKVHTEESFKKYVLGSAEVVGLMCLKIFVEGNEELYKRLTPEAMSLGAAFQKVNFLRDMRADFEGLGRSYFPGIDLTRFNEEDKQQVQEAIEKDFDHALSGIKQLPKTSRFGVYLAYAYYKSLFKKIKNTPPHLVLRSRIRIPSRRKATLMAFSYLRHQLNLI